MIRAGMTAQGYHDENGEPLERQDLLGIDADGDLVERKDSTPGVAQGLGGPVAPDEVLMRSLLWVYILEPSELDPGLASCSP